jgi:type IV pilus assembly protein PilE
MCFFKRSSGFTLIELMMAVAVIGILSAIAYPSYTEYGKRAKRADGKAGLLKLQLEQEKYRASCPQYANGIHATTTSCVTGGAHNLVANTSSPDGHYTLAITAADAVSYTLTATPSFTDAKCGTLGINQAGVKTVTGSDSVSNCWGK